MIAAARARKIENSLDWNKIVGDAAVIPLAALCRVSAAAVAKDEALRELSTAAAAQAATIAAACGAKGAVHATAIGAAVPTLATAKAALAPLLAAAKRKKISAPVLETLAAIVASLARK